MKEVPFILLVSLFLFFFIFLPKSVSAACWCLNPLADGCDCTYTNSPTGAFYEISGACPIISGDINGVPASYPAHPEFCDGQYYDANVNGVAIRCNTSFEANSADATLSPICVLGKGAEIPPNCAPAIGNSNFVTCWGTGYLRTPLPDDFPRDTFGVAQTWPRAFNYNGYDIPAGAGLVTCSSNNFCCTSSYCDNTRSVTMFDNSISLCQPASTPTNRNPMCGGDAEGGESRLWFSQPRLIAALSTLAQTMMNPLNLNDLYKNTAFSKNAPPSNTSGEISNPGAVATKIEEHQGIDDSTRVVNTTDNNSSLIAGDRAPRPLYTYGNTFDDNPYNDHAACRIPGAINNEGDDLIGPKVEAELFYTQKYQYLACPKPAGCVADDAFSGTVLVTDRDPDIVAAEIKALKENCCSITTDDIAIADGCYAEPREQEVCETEPPECYAGSDCSVGNECINGLCQSPTCDVPPGECAQLKSICSMEIYCGTIPGLDFPAQGKAAVFDKEPLIEYLYDTIVTGADSLFKRFMPDFIGKNRFEELPSSAGFGVTATGYNQENTSVSLRVADGLTTNPTLYFPHIGSLAKYWLSDFQAALRPQGFGGALGSGLPTGGTPGLPVTSGSCSESTSQYCTSQYLLPFFDNDPSKAANASQICRAESGGNPTVVNRSCTYSNDGIDNDGDGCIDLQDAPGNTNSAGQPCTPRIIGGTEYWYDGATVDFSVGLFQVNLLAHCRTAFAGYTWGPPATCTIINDGTNCTDLVPGLTQCNATLRACLIEFMDPVNNINKAVAISNHGNNWCGGWLGTATQCGLCP